MKFSLPPISYFPSSRCGDGCRARAGARARSRAAVAPTALVQEIVSKNPELAFYQAEMGAAKTRTRAAAAFNDPERALDLGRKRVREPSGVFAYGKKSRARYAICSISINSGTLFSNAVTNFPDSRQQENFAWSCHHHPQLPEAPGLRNYFEHARRKRSWTWQQRK